MGSNIGSHALVMTDVANPAVVNGVTNWNDPGKVSFVWGTETFNSYSGAACIVVPVGDAGAAVGGATTYTCYYLCDS